LSARTRKAKRTQAGPPHRYHRPNVKRQPYPIILTADAEAHLAALAAGEMAMVASAIERQLKYQPTVETRNRKRMDVDKRLYIAPWEPRVEHLRVYYAVTDDPERVVVIVAVGEKDRNRVRIGGKVIEP